MHNAAPLSLQFTGLRQDLHDSEYQPARAGKAVTRVLAAFRRGELEQQLPSPFSGLTTDR